MSRAGDRLISTSSAHEFRSNGGSLRRLKRTGLPAATVPCSPIAKNPAEVESVADGSICIASRRHLKDLSVDELDGSIGVQQPDLAHAVIFVDHPQMPGSSEQRDSTFAPTSTPISCLVLWLTRCPAMAGPNGDRAAFRLPPDNAPKFPSPCPLVCLDPSVFRWESRFGAEDLRCRLADPRE